MSILSDSAIRRAMMAEDIVISPFDLECLGGNSYDVHLSKYVKVYDIPACTERWAGIEARSRAIDCRKATPTIDREIHEDGMLLRPGELYLCSTVECTTTKRHVPYLDGKSSIGRLGISIHATAGRGDVGFSGYWTLEVQVALPVVVHPGMPIGQLTFHSVKGQVEKPYHTKDSAKYADARHSGKPQASRMWMNWDGKKWR